MLKNDVKLMRLHISSLDDNVQQLSDLIHAGRVHEDMEHLMRQITVDMGEVMIGFRAIASSEEWNDMLNRIKTTGG